MLKVDLLKDNLLDRLVEIVGADIVSFTEDHDGSSKIAEYNLCQLALMGLQLLCRLLGGRNPELFSAVSDL